MANGGSRVKSRCLAPQVVVGSQALNFICCSERRINKSLLVLFYGTAFSSSRRKGGLFNATLHVQKGSRHKCKLYRAGELRTELAMGLGLPKRY